MESLQPLKVDFRVPAVYLRLLEVGQPLRIRVDAFPDETFTGTVYAIDPRIDVNGRAVALRATIPNEDGRLRPGLFARVTLVVDRREDAIIVPEQAIVPRGDEKFVFKVLDGKAVMSPVRTGQRREGPVELIEGLAGGDGIVTSGRWEESRVGKGGGRTGRTR